MNAASSAGCVNDADARNNVRQVGDAARDRGRGPAQRQCSRSASKLVVTKG